MKTYLLLRNNKQSGPFTLDEMLTMGLRSQDLIWIEGKSASWRYPSELDEFKGQVAAPVLEDPVDIGFTQVQNTIVYSMPPSALPVEPVPALEMNGFPTLTSFMRQSGEREKTERPRIFVAAETAQEFPSAVFQTLAGTDDSLDAMPTMAWQAAPTATVENIDQPLSPLGSPEKTAPADAPAPKPLFSKILVTLPAAVPDKTLVVIGRKGQATAAPQSPKPLIRRPVLEFITEPEMSQPLSVDAGSRQTVPTTQVESVTVETPQKTGLSIVLPPTASDIVEIKPLESLGDNEAAGDRPAMASEIAETKPFEWLDENETAGELQSMTSASIEAMPLELQGEKETGIVLQNLTAPKALASELKEVAVEENDLQRLTEVVSDPFSVSGQSNASGELPVPGNLPASDEFPGESDAQEIQQDPLLTHPFTNHGTGAGVAESMDSVLANLAVTVPAEEQESSSTLRVNIRTIQKVAVTAAILSLIAVAVLIANSIFNPDAYNYQNLPQQQVPVKADTQPVRDGGTGTGMEQVEGQKSTDAGTSSNRQSQPSPTNESDIVPVVNHEK